MIEVGVPKDIREYEPTLIMWFTTRQVICIIAICILVYAGYYFEKAIGIADPLQQPFFVILAVPPFLIGWFKPYGMNLEDFLFNAINDNYIAKQNRYYEVENMWDDILKENLTEEKREVRKNGGRVETKEKFQELPKNRLPKQLRPYK